MQLSFLINLAKDIKLLLSSFLYKFPWFLILNLFPLLSILLLLIFLLPFNHICCCKYLVFLPLLFYFLELSYLYHLIQNVFFIQLIFDLKTIYISSEINFLSYFLIIHHIVRNLAKCSFFIPFIQWKMLKGRGYHFLFFIILK